MQKIYINNKGFTLIEIIVTIAIIGFLSTIVTVSVNTVRIKARDTKRKVELSQIGKFFSASSCFVPDAGPGDYDLATLFNELKSKYPQANNFKLPTDPKTGNNSTSNYRYKVSENNQCILYANLENKDEPITLNSVSSPGLGVGTGILRADTAGPNGTNIYYQYSK